MQFQGSKKSSLVATIWCPYLARPHKLNIPSYTKSVKHWYLFKLLLFLDWPVTLPWPVESINESRRKVDRESIYHICHLFACFNYVQGIIINKCLGNDLRNKRTNGMVNRSYISIDKENQKEYTESGQYIKFKT